LFERLFVPPRLSELLSDGACVAAMLASTMPHKRNPIGSARARACARHTEGAAALLLGALERYRSS